MIPDGPRLAAHTGWQTARLLYHEWQMRRLLSIWMILFFGVGPLAAMAGDSENARLPACCRRHGAHHCAMQMGGAMQSDGSGRASLAAPSTCPMFPGDAAQTVSSAHALATSAVSLPALLSQPHSPAAARAAARLSRMRMRAGRGPPVASLV